MESMQVKRDVSLANNIIESEDNFQTDTEKYFLRIYPFLTENLKAYMPDVKDKNIITVGSSGDQVLNAELHGAKKIVCIDINRFTKYYYALKRAAIAKLPLEDFIIYFYYNRKEDNNNSFAPGVFKKISKLLDEDSRYFWEELYKRYSPEDIRANLFIYDDTEPEYLCRYNEYLEQDKYKELRKIVGTSDVSFICDDVTNAKTYKKMPKNNFDYVMLSDVYQYYINDPKSIEKLRRIALAIKEIMVNDGEAFLLYKFYPLLSQLSFKDIFFIKTHLLLPAEVKKFESCVSLRGMGEEDRETNDAVLVYKKK